MKYSLRSLMIGITLVCVLLGGRIEYLRRMAAYHDRMADEIAATIHAYVPLDRDDLDEMATIDWRFLAKGFRGKTPQRVTDRQKQNAAIVFSDEFSEFAEHRFLADSYRRATFCPWTEPSLIPGEILVVRPAVRDGDSGQGRPTLIRGISP